MTIAGKLRERRLQKLDRSERGRTNYEKQVSQHEEAVADIVAGKSANEGVPPELISLRSKYQSLLERYSHKRITFPHKMNARSVALWKRVAAAQAHSEVSQDRFLKAQFDWFHQQFGKAPEPVQLTTEAAVDRARAFAGKTDGHVVADIPKTASLAEKFRWSEKTLQQMMKAQNCSREELYRRFVIPGLFSFPEEFLHIDPVYLKVRDGG